MKSALLASLYLIVTALPVQAEQFRVGSIVVDRPWSRATPRGAPVAGGYMVIVNAGETADRLVGASSAVSATAQVHEMSMKDGVMTMHQLAAGLTIPAHGSISLTPGRYHLMFLGLKTPLAKGQTVEATLEFEHAGTLPIELKVGGAGEQGPPP